MMKNQLYAITTERLVEAGFCETDENYFTMKQAEDISVELQLYGENNAEMFITRGEKTTYHDIQTWDQVVHALTGSLC